MPGIVRSLAERPHSDTRLRKEIWLRLSIAQLSLEDLVILRLTRHLGC